MVHAPIGPLEGSIRDNRCSGGRRSNVRGDDAAVFLTRDHASPVLDPLGRDVIRALIDDNSVREIEILTCFVRHLGHFVELSLAARDKTEEVLPDRRLGSVETTGFFRGRAYQMYVGGSA